MDRQVTPPRRVTSPTWGPPRQCKQAPSVCLFQVRMIFEAFLSLKSLRFWGADVLHCSPWIWQLSKFSVENTYRGGQLGREKRRRKFSRTGERALGMLRLTNKFHDSFECSLTGHKKKWGPIGGQHSLSCCSSDLLIRRSLPVNSTVCRTCLARAREPSSRRVFSENTENKEIR